MRSFAKLEITYDSFVNCTPAYNVAMSIFPFKLNYRQVKDQDVAFQMLNDDFMSTLNQVGAMK